VLSVLIPCFNEAEGLPLLEADLFGSLAALGCAYEVLAVDDGSTDSTETLLREMAARHPELRLLSHEANRGIGAAIKTALREAQGDWLIPMDADLSFHPRHIRALLEAQRGSEADCVGGSPHGAGFCGVPWARRIPSLAVNAAYRALFGAGLASYTPMFRLYRTSALRSIGFRSDGFEVSAEIAVLMLRAGHRVVEVPVPLTTRSAGHSKLSGPRELCRHIRLIARLLPLRDQPVSPPLRRP